VIRLSRWFVHRAPTIGFLLVLSSSVTNEVHAQQGSCFVQREGTGFFLNGCPYRWTGTNQYFQMIHRRGMDRISVNEVLDEMAARGMTVLRTWAFQDDSGRSDCLQCAPIRQLGPSDSPVSYLRESTFRGLDELLVEAAARGIRVILTLANNWDDFGGMRRYTLWRFGPQGAGHDAFYNDPIIRMSYEEYVSRIVNRVNYLNGRRYRDDPTILAWELANEPRCFDEPCRTEGWVDSWILDMSCFIKSLDPNHLVTTGSEGFYGAARADGNPETWMADAGTDFVDNHSGPCIDFATVHVWPVNWGWEPISQTDRAFELARAYTARRLADGLNVLQKPVVISEFGMARDDRSACGDPGNPGTTGIRDRYYQLMYGLCEESAFPVGSCAGALNWIVYDGPSCAYDDGNGVFLPDDASTDLIMTEHVRRFASCSEIQEGGEFTCSPIGSMDWDCDVDHLDYGQFHECLSGPDLDPDSACKAADWFIDGRVDLRDFAEFQLAYSGRCP